MDFACNILARAEHRSSSDIAQLLVVISDGRGVLNEGEEQVRGAVRRARLQGILMVFVIVDNPDSKVCFCLVYIILKHKYLAYVYYPYVY